MLLPAEMHKNVLEEHITKVNFGIKIKVSIVFSITPVSPSLSIRVKSVFY